jgi:4-hydroxy-3-methylbut-2-enyl diphosphate reductase
MTLGLSTRPDAVEHTHRTPVVVAPLRIEARAFRRASEWAEVTRSGMGPRRAADHAARVLDGGRPTVITGFCGGLAEDMAPGDVVLATELWRGEDGRVVCDDPTILAGLLRRAGLRVHVGPIQCSEKIVSGAEQRRRLREAGAVAVDMESAWLAPPRRSEPLVTLRAVLDTGERELYRPLRTLTGAAAAYRSLRRASELVGEWARALGPREIVLAAPRASCAGVERAIEIVERALELRGAPLYVRRQIVHNAHVIASFERRGVIFVQELDEVPDGSTVIFSAHGVAPQVRREAQRRGLAVIDATCPLVSKVHAEARRYAAAGYDIALVGHRNHDEVEGTVGEAPDRITVVPDAAAALEIQVRDPRKVAYLSQTTLAVDETGVVFDAIRARFPGAVGPASSDICYATQNRQDAARALASDCDLVLVVGSRNSSNSCRLVEVAERAGVNAILVEDAEQIPPAALMGVRRIGLTAGASAPEALVEAVIGAVGGLGEVAVTERTVATETVHFKLPAEVSRGDH